MTAYNTAATYNTAAIYDGNTLANKPVMSVLMSADYSGSQYRDITSYVQRLRITRGRGPLALDNYDPGRLALELVDFDSSFLPANTGGFMPTVDTPITVRMTWAGETIPLYFGFVDDIKTQWVKGATVAYTSMNCTDGTKLLAQATTSVDGTASQRPAERIAAYLADINLGTPPVTSTLAYNSATAYNSAAVYGGDATTPYSIDTLTEATLQIDTVDRRSALVAIRRVEQAEAGALFFDGAGRVCFRGRGQAWPSSTSPVVGVFTDAPVASTDMTYTAIQAVTDDQLVSNRVTVTRDSSVSPTPVEQVATYSTVTAKRDLNLQSVILADDQQCATLAAFLLAKRQVPLQRFEQVDMSAYGSLANLIGALNLDLLDVVSVRRAAPSYTSTTTVVISGVQHDITPADWRVQYSTQSLV